MWTHLPTTVLASWRDLHEILRRSDPESWLTRITKLVLYDLLGAAVTVADQLEGSAEFECERCHALIISINHPPEHGKVCARCFLGPPTGVITMGDHGYSPKIIH